MIKKPTWILLIIFFIALSLAVFLDKNPGVTSGLRTSTPTVYPNLLIGVSPSSISAVEFIPTQGEKLLLERNADNTWKINSQQTLASNGKIEQLLTNISDLKIYAEMASDLSKDDVGLTSNPAILNILNNNGKKFQVKIGKITPTDSGYYAQVDAGPVIVVSKFGMTSVLDMLNLKSIQDQQLTPEPSEKQP